MPYRQYLIALVMCGVAWAGLYLAFTLTVDPYGVSPLKISSEGFNEYKPKRVDIDRVIKPYEVWRYQPHTVFLGTSRIHQSIDPAVLDGTGYAPAYNASIPASSLGLNVAHLRQYVELDPHLKTVFVELFLYNFLGQGQERTRKTLKEFVQSSANLFVSNDALWASVVTFAYNLLIHKPIYEIKSGGYYYYPPGHDATGPFAGFPAGIWPLHETRAAGMELHEPAFESLREIVKVAQKHKLELVFLLTPNHAYDDYYIDAIGAWDKVEEWLRRLSAEPITIYSFSQPNPWVYEPVRKPMRYWNDPYHFSLEMGNAMQFALTQRKFADMPDGFMVRMTPENIAEHIASRRAAIREWAKVNPSFVAAFQEERRRWERRKVTGSDLVVATMTALASLQQKLVEIYPGGSITAYQDVSADLVAANAVPPDLLNNGKIQNLWGGRIVTQIFPAGAWGAGVPATHNYFFESVPITDCSRLVEAVVRANSDRMFRVNLEPSGKIHARFPVSGADGCVAGKNTIGFTQFIN